MNITIENRIKPRGRIELPPSKSEAIRAAILLALAGEDPRRAVEGYPAPFCRDIECALSAVREERPFVGGSAALLRMLLPVLLVTRGEAEIRAEKRLLERGVGELADCLGTEARISGDTLFMRGFPDKKCYCPDCTRSSQFLSGLLIALPLLGHECEIRQKGLVSRPYAEMTVDFVRLFGGKIEEAETGFITGPSVYKAPRSMKITGDRSYAAVFEAMNRLGGEIGILGAGGTRQPDKAFSELAELSECDITDCPDLLPLLAAVACGKEGDTVIRGTKRLKTKESDRESGTAALINDLGGSAVVNDDAVVIHGSGRLAGGRCSAMDDHRLAFAAAVMAVISEKPVMLEGAECVTKSAPQFWDDLERLGYELDRK